MSLLMEATFRRMCRQMLARREKREHSKLDLQQFLGDTLVTELWLKSACIDVIQKKDIGPARVLLDEIVEQEGLSEEEAMRIVGELCEPLSELGEHE